MSEQQRDPVVTVGPGEVPDLVRADLVHGGPVTGPVDPQAIPARCGVVGGGRMGAGIAHALLLAGAEVHLVERDVEVALAARTRVVDALEETARRGVTVGVDVASRLAVSDTVAALTDCGLVIECVPEDRELKAQVLAAVEDVVGDTAVIASNTSSISITDLAAPLRERGRVIGLHFFNPVPSSRLVEIVVGAVTGPDLVERARGWVAAMDKEAIVVADRPGFASSRLGVLLGLEAIRMVEEGVAGIADIDAAMVLGYGHPMGPLRLTDLVGLDVRLDVARHLSSTLGARFTPPQLLVDKVARGELGRKAGVGFYRW